MRILRPSLACLLVLSCADPTSPTTDSDAELAFARCGTPPCGGGQNKASSALNFDGVNDGAQTPDAADLDLTTAFTVEAWIHPTAPQATQQIISKWGLSVTASYNVGFQPDGRLTLTTHMPGANPDNTVLASAQPLQAGSWGHFAFVFEQGAVWLYLDGQLDSQRAGMNTPQVSATPLSLGRENSLQGFIGWHYAGVLDEVRIWNVARSEREIARNMDKKLSGKQKGLVAYWRLNEGSGQVAADKTGNGHDMQLGDSAGADAADPAWVSPGR